MINYTELRKRYQAHTDLRKQNDAGATLFACLLIAFWIIAIWIAVGVKG